MGDWGNDRLYLLGVKERRLRQGLIGLEFNTTRGDFEALYHPSPGTTNGVLLLGETRDDTDGSSGLYEDLASHLSARGHACLRLRCRFPDNCTQSGLDSLVALQYMDDEGIRNVAIVGWSRAGMTALSVASVARNVCAVAGVFGGVPSGDCLRRLGAKLVLLLCDEVDGAQILEATRRVRSDISQSCRVVSYPDPIVQNGIGEQVAWDIERWVVDALRSSSVEAAAAQ